MGSTLSQPKKYRALDLSSNVDSIEDLGDLAVLPLEIVECVLSFLEPHDLCPVYALNHTFNRIILSIFKQACMSSPFFDQSQPNMEHNFNWKAFYFQQIKLGWKLSTSPRMCGEGLIVGKNQLSLTINQNYKGLATMHRAITQRGIWKGKHQFRVRAVALQSNTGVSFGVCGASIAPHGETWPCTQIWTGDGTLNIHPGSTIISQGRIKGSITQGSVVTVELDVENKTVSFLVDEVRWATVENVTLQSREKWHFFIGVRPSSHHRHTLLEVVS